VRPDLDDGADSSSADSFVESVLEVTPKKVAADEVVSRIWSSVSRQPGHEVFRPPRVGTHMGSGHVEEMRILSRAVGHATPRPSGGHRSNTTSRTGCRNTSRRWMAGSVPLARPP